MGRFFGFLWRGLDGLRRVLHLVLLLVIFGFIVGALRSSIPLLPAEAALVIAPVGEIVEQLSGDPFERALAEAQGTGRSETLLRDLTEAIRAGAKDDRVRALVLDLNAMTGGGQPTLEELAGAVADFRASGKPVIAHSVTFLQDQYLVAAHADEIYVDPLGLVILEGYERYRNYYKAALDKLGVDINVFKVGSYKSAVEPFLRQDMSPEDREASLAYLAALWDNYRDVVAQARGLEPEALTRYADDIGPAAAAARGDLPAVALAAKLVTGIKSSLDVEARIAEIVGSDEQTGSYHAIYLDDYLRVQRAEQKLHGDGKARVGVIVASGEILDGDQPPGIIGGETLAGLVRDARMDDDIRALVLRIDSPGGSVLASEQIHRELKAFKATGRPLVVSMGDLAASGGYYIAAPADEIWASPGTITGSIGIFALFPTLNRTLDKVGVSVDGVGTTPLSGELRLDRPVGPVAGQLLQSMIERGYADFLALVAEGRGRKVEEIEPLAQGRVWSGRDAQRNGLVDQLGGFDAAVESAAQRANLAVGEYHVDYLESDLSWAEELAMSFKVRLFNSLVEDSPSIRQALRLATLADPLQREVARWERMRTPNHLYAYCFCEAR
ncbi:MAG: signal peptide peptidase SppA [Steroidobacteraceae bacterium]